MGARKMYGAIEAGGTKFVCAAGYGPGEAAQQFTEVIPTTTPEATLAAVLTFFDRIRAAAGEFAAIGIGAFGPVDTDPQSATWGRILDTPKQGWSNVSLVAPLERYGCPIFLDTDVNAAALAEMHFGAAMDVDSLVYVTVGTGIGGGVIAEGRTVRGLLHPEMGHIRVRRDPRDSAFTGVCPFHGDCLEGLASGPAVLGRWNVKLESLPDDHPGLSIIGGYLGQLAATVELVLSTRRIIFGGGVVSERLLPHIRAAAEHELAGYLPIDARAGGFGQLIVCPALANRAGITGAMLLASR